MAKRVKMTRVKRYGAHEPQGTKSDYQKKLRAKRGRGTVNPNWQWWFERAA